MFLLRESIEEEKVFLDEGTADRSFGLQEGRNLCKKIIDRAKTSNTGGYDTGVIKDSIAGVLDGLNMHLLQLLDKDKSATLNKISVLLDDAFTEISKVK
jgi:hypothetical protein